MFGIKDMQGDQNFVSGGNSTHFVVGRDKMSCMFRYVQLSWGEVLVSPLEGRLPPLATDRLMTLD